jgi:hypothetical protein
MTEKEYATQVQPQSSSAMSATQAALAAQAIQAAAMMFQEPQHAVEDPEAFDRYCRSAGALDLFDLFQIEVGDATLADAVRDRFPNELAERIRALFPGDPPGDGDILEAGNWDVVKNFFLGYTLDKVKLIESIFVPVFCAHPVLGIENSKVTVEASETTSREIGFSIHVAGIRGGIGCTQSLTFKSKVEESPYSYQLQVRISGLLRKWISDRTSRTTLCPIPSVDTPDTRETDSNQPEYLTYDVSAKSHRIKRHIQSLSTASTKGVALTIGGQDVHVRAEPKP